MLNNLLPEQEKILIEESINGNNKSFETLINLQKTKLLSLRTIAKDFNDSDFSDCYQIAAQKAFESLKDFHKKCSFTTWFYVILKNEIIQFSKKKNFINSQEISINSMGQNENEDNLDNLFGKLEENARTIISKQEELNEYKEILEKCLEKIEPKYSEVLKLAFVENKTRKEISSILKIPLGSVLSRIYVARQKAQKVITSYTKANNLTIDCIKQHV